MGVRVGRHTKSAFPEEEVVDLLGKEGNALNRYIGNRTSIEVQHSDLALEVKGSSGQGLDHSIVHGTSDETQLERGG